jgi:CBS domain-containing protein
MKVNELMTRDVTLADPDMTLQAAASLMRDCDFGVLPVGENDRLVGVITDRDIAVRAVADGRDPASTTVRDTMSPGIRWIFEDSEAAAAAQMMTENQIRRLPVISRDKRLVGIVSLGDFAVESSSIRPAAEALSGVSKGAGQHR